MKDVVRMIRRHFDGVVAQTQRPTVSSKRSTACFRLQSVAHGYTNFNTMRTVLFLTAGEAQLRLDQFTCGLTHSKFKRALDLVLCLNLDSAKRTEKDRLIKPPRSLICLNASDSQKEDP